MSIIENKRILVTGGAGFIGSHLIDIAFEEGASTVIGLDNLCAGNLGNINHLRNNPAFLFVEGDVCDVSLVDKLVNDVDVVFHLAASKLVVSRDNPRTDLNTNIIGTFNILEASRKKRPRIVHASTGSVLGDASTGEMYEDHPKKPSTLYGISKSSGEEYCRFYAREFGVPVSIVRYFHVFGPRQDYQGEAGVINIFMSRIFQDKPPLINKPGHQIRCFTFVKDTARATFLVAEKKKTIGEIYNIASHTRCRIDELAKILIERYGKPGLVSEFVAPRPGENIRPIPNTEKIEALGWKPLTGFDEGIRITADWIKEDLKTRLKGS